MKKIKNLMPTLLVTLIMLFVFVTGCKKDEDPKLPEPKFMVGTLTGIDIGTQKAIGQKEITDNYNSVIAVVTYYRTLAWIAGFKKELYSKNITTNKPIGNLVESRQYIVDLGFRDSVGTEKVKDIIDVDKNLKDMFSKIKEFATADTTGTLSKTMDIGDSLKTLIVNMNIQIMQGTLSLTPEYLENFIQVVDKNYAYFYTYFYNFFTPDSKKKMSGPGIERNVTVEGLEWLKENHREKMPH